MRDRAGRIARAAASAHQPALQAEARDLGARLGGALRAWPLPDVGDLLGVPAPTETLLRDDRYSTVLHLYRELLLASKIVWEGAAFVHDSFDVAGLYEMWVYLQVLRAVASIGASAEISLNDADSLVRVDQEALTFRLSRGERSLVQFIVGPAMVTVAYNQTFSALSGHGSNSQRRATYSVGLRPDVTVAIDNGSTESLLLVDAKYRLDRIGPELGFSFIDDEENFEPPSGSFKRSDVYKMHTYRDAIRGATIAIAAYPGTQRRDFPVDGDSLVRSGGVAALPLPPTNRGPETATRATSLTALREIVLNLATK
jgi:predicted component of viral defense system (DUF524 family)